MTLLNETAKGVYIIAVTPFRDDGEIDFASTDRVVDFYLEKGATGLTVLGMMGEAPKLTSKEAHSLVSHVLARVAGRVMIAPPSTLRTDDQIVSNYSMAAETGGPKTPFVLQDFPIATQVQITPQVIRRVVADNPNCVMLKHEDWPGLAKISELRSASDSGERRISILVGNGGVFLPEELSRGADGAMTGFACPEMMVDVWKAHAAGQTARAHDLFDAYLPLARYEQQPGAGLAIRKYILAKRGVIASANLRKPGSALSRSDIADIEQLIMRQERRLQELG